MSRTAIDAATEITVAWIAAHGAGGQATGAVASSRLTPDHVVAMFDAVYRMANELNKPPELETGKIDF